MPRIVLKIIYLISSLICLCLIFVMGAIVLNHNTQGAQCDIYLWQSGKIIGQIDFQTWFNWYWDDRPCRFTTGAVFGIYLFAVPLYWLLREAGTKLWKTSNTGCFMAIEYLLWLLAYVAVLIIKMIYNQIPVSWNILYNAGIGGLVLSLPLLGFILMIIWAKDEH